MRFSDLLSSAQVAVRQRRGEAEITSIVADSRRCKPGRCFVAVRGWSDDGHKYIPQALAAGASAVVCEDPADVPQDVPCAVIERGRLGVALLAQAFYGWPARKLVTVGMTGTNGKTTTTIIIREVLQACGHMVALLGTINYETGSRVVPSGQTTPDPLTLAEMMSEMVAAGKTHLVMEVSSHALHQDRTAGLEFRVGAFSNLTGDHLDYHKTMEEYLLAKCRLFEQLPPSADAVINQDDPAGARLAKVTKAPVTWYGLSPAADLRGRIESIDALGTRFDMIHGGKTVPVHTPLIGRHNVYNCLAAAGCCKALGVDLEKVAQVLEKLNVVPGRLERVDEKADFGVFVDYAHTDDALVNVLSALRPVTAGRIVLVFGCGGDRDRTKRPRMARVAQDLADRIVVTSDNPRSEQAGAIIDEIMGGFNEQGRARTDIEPDRRAAINMAIDMAGAGDIVLIAGKGHEKYQIIGARRDHFDDVEEATMAIRRREGRR